MRPRKQFRRSLSMFEHPADMMKEDKNTLSTAATLDAIMDIDDVPQLQLPHFISEEESLPRITKETMIDVLDGKYQQRYNKAIVVDCRFEYEYNGGHIEGAVNVNSKEELAKKLFDSPLSEKTLLIFHCEYSAHRAPLMYAFLFLKNVVILTMTPGPSSSATRTVLKMPIVIRSYRIQKCTFSTEGTAHFSWIIDYDAFPKTMWRWMPRSMLLPVSVDLDV